MAGQITKRSKLIIDLLLKQETYVSGSFIAKQLGVSKRTILREMNEVERQVKKNGAVLERVPGKGVKLIVDSDSSFIKDFHLTSVEEYFNPEERQRFLMIELISANEILKLYYFASKFKISEATVSNDLDKIEPWLNKRKLQLIRKPGYGVKIEGHERDIRKTIVELVYDNFSRDELMSFLKKQYKTSIPQSLRSDIKKRLLNIIGDNTLNGIENAIEKSGVLATYQLADNAYVALVVHLSLAVQRLMGGEKIHFDPVLLDELSESPEYDMATKIIEVTAKNLDIQIPVDEVGYVTMHLQGAKFRSNSDKEASFKIHDYEIIHLAEQLVQIMERKAGLVLSDNRRLLTDLVNHMGPAFTRIKMGMIIRNPLLDQIKSQYSEYFSWTQASVNSLEERIGKAIPEDEVGYLTMHFGAAIESSIKRKTLVWRVIIACSTGIGSSKLLESRVRKLYKNIEIVSVRSTRNIESVIQKENVDFLISTVKLNQDIVPTVVVSPLLLDEDALKIDTMLNRVDPKRVERKGHKGFKFVEKLARIRKVSTAGESILKNYFYEMTSDDNTDHLINIAVQQLDSNDPQQLKKDFLKREIMGQTIICEGRANLLHCRSKAIDCPQIGFIRMMEDRDLDFSVVMVAPDSSDAISRSLLGTITQKIAESEDWVHAVLSNDIESVYKYLEHVIEDELETMLNILED